MASLVVWAVFIAVAVLLGLVAHNFSLRTVRWVSAITAVALLCLITKYGINLWLQQHLQSQSANLNLVNAFTGGVDASIKDLLRPLLLGYQGSPPGPIGRGAAAFLLIVGYRELEAWAMQRQAPQLDSSVLIDGQPSVPSGDAGASADGGDGDAITDAQLHDQLAAELKFRLAALEVRAPAILPGGSRTSGLASIAEATGSSAAGLAGAIIRFAGSIWPNPRQLQLRVWVEPRDKPAESKTPPPKPSGTQATVYLENPRNGATVASKTLACADINEAASMVAGYIGRQVFSRDPSTPPWCYGRVDGRDLGVLLQARLERVPAETARAVEESRRSQINVMQRWASTGRSAGLVRYELAQLLDLDGDHLAALRLHALNREQYPRFYRDRYRLGMSLEMIASPECVLHYDHHDTKSQLDEILGILSRQRLTTVAKCADDDVEPCCKHDHCCALSPSLRLVLLTAAATVFDEVRMKLTLRRVVWDTIRHRSERTIWLAYWPLLPGRRTRRRWAFQDGVRVAELLVALRIELIRAEIGEKPQYKDVREALRESPYRKDPGRYEHAIRIAFAIGQQDEIISRALDHDLTRTPGRASPWLRWQAGKVSWQAAYNTACLYATVARRGRTYEALKEQSLKEQALQEHAQAAVVRCLRSAIDDPYSEMERPSDWISKDPDLSCLSGQGEGSQFQAFLDDQKGLDYPRKRSSGHGKPRATELRTSRSRARPRAHTS